MVNDFEEEAHLIEKKDNVQDKLMIMAIYNEIYNRLKCSMSSYYSACYEAFMRDSFMEVIQNVNNSKEFVSKYIIRLKKDRLTHTVQGILENLAYFEELKDDLDDEFDFVPIIDKYNIPFDVKVKIVVLFRDYLNNLVGRTYKTFGDNDSSKEMNNDVIDYLLIALESFLDEWMSHNIKPNYICNSLEDVLKMAAKVVLTNKFIDGDFSFELIESENLKDYFLSFKPMEQNVLLLLLAHGISGYQEDDHKEERMNEICKILGITKARYHLIITSLSFKKTMLLRKSVKEKVKLKNRQ